MLEKKTGDTLETYLEQKVFVHNREIYVEPASEDRREFMEFMKRYMVGLAVEREASVALN
jgi:hypothetical protein